MSYETAWTEIGQKQQRESAAPMDPQLRRARRQMLKRSMAAARVAGQRHETILGEIRDCERRKDEAAAEHLAKCAPLREQIAAIDRTAIDLMLAEKPADEKGEQRRRKLLAEIHQLGVLLDDAHDAIDLEMSRLNAERVELAAACHLPSIENELLQLASPEKLQRYREARAGLLYGVDAEQAYWDCVNDTE